jgi:multiple sugar transport system permease protein
VNPPYWFLAPALSVIVIFFFVPVAASVVLSLTDFDIYAVASRSDLRFVGPDNYLRLVHEPLFWVEELWVQHGSNSWE